MCSYVEVNLASDTAWHVTNSNGSVQVPAHVPGHVHIDLGRAGVLHGDPLYRFNELEFRYVYCPPQNRTCIESFHFHCY